MQITAGSDAFACDIITAGRESSTVTGSSVVTGAVVGVMTAVGVSKVVGVTGVDGVMDEVMVSIHGWTVFNFRGAGMGLMAVGCGVCVVVGFGMKGRARAFNNFGVKY